jgi:hypothetical protein
LKDAKKMLELWKMCDTFLIKQRWEKYQMSVLFDIVRK